MELEFNPWPFEFVLLRNDRVLLMLNKISENPRLPRSKAGRDSVVMQRSGVTL